MKQFLNFPYLVAPQIAQFTFGEGPSNAGDIISVQCVVSKGDLPLEIEWMFNGRPVLQDQKDLIVSNSGKRLKMLTIESVVARHAGEYTCVASNEAGSSSRSAVLDVNGTNHKLQVSCNLLGFMTIACTKSYPSFWDLHLVHIGNTSFRIRFLAVDKKDEGEKCN